MWFPKPSHSRWCMLCSPQPYGQQQQHRAPHGLPWFLGAQQWPRQLQTPAHLLQPALRTDLLQQWVRTPVWGGLLRLLPRAGRPLPGLLQRVILPERQPERMESLKKSRKAQGKGGFSKVPVVTCNKSFINCRSVWLDLWSSLPLGLLPPQTELYVPEVPLTSHWVAALWQKQTLSIFLFTHFYLYLFIYRVFLLHFVQTMTHIGGNKENDCLLTLFSLISRLSLLQSNTCFKG